MFVAFMIDIQGTDGWEKKNMVDYDGNIRTVLRCPFENFQFLHKFYSKVAVSHSSFIFPITLFQEVMSDSHVQAIPQDTKRFGNPDVCPRCKVDLTGVGIIGEIVLSEKQEMECCIGKCLYLPYNIISYVCMSLKIHVM